MAKYAKNLFMIRGSVTELVSSRLSPRRLARIMKIGLKETLLFWHRKYQHLNFRRPALGRIHNSVGNIFGGFGKFRLISEGNVDPLHISGTLMERVTSFKSKADVPGTARKARLIVRYGRPPEFTEESLRRATFIAMEDFKLSYREAQSRVYSDSTYFSDYPGASGRAKMVMSLITDQDFRKMKEFLRDFVIFAEKNMPARRKRITI